MFSADHALHTNARSADRTIEVAGKFFLQTVKGVYTCQPTGSFSKIVSR
jgi:hypothetical protein